VCQEKLAGALNQNKKTKADYTMKNKYNLIARVAVVALVLTATFAFTTNASAVSYSAYGPGGVNTAGGNTPDATLWYNGDFNGVNGLANERNTVVSQAAVYEDFIIPNGQSWLITGLFSDNLANTTIGAADWEIRSGVSEGNGGALLASGSNAAATVSLTGRSGFGFLEYMVQVNGLSVNLGPGTYWMNVTPVGNGSGRSFNSTTSGANCIGTPCGNDMNAFFNSTFFGANFTATSNESQPSDFSNGVIGTIVPEPATIALLTCGVGALLIAVRRRRSS
jgi:hypothetical protein